jgi:hypothetical protein
MAESKKVGGKFTFDRDTMGMQILRWVPDPPKVYWSEALGRFVTVPESEPDA